MISQFLDELVLFVCHSDPLLLGLVVIPHQMEDAVDEQQRQTVLHSKLGGHGTTHATVLVIRQYSILWHLVKEILQQCHS